MEIISKNDVLNEIRGLKKTNIINDLVDCKLDTRGTMCLVIASHVMTIKYQENGSFIIYTLDGKLIKDCSLKSLYHLLDTITDYGKLKIFQINSNSDKWKKIVMTDEEIDLRIKEKLQSLGILTGYKGFIYLCESMQMVCKTHIQGDTVDIKEITQKLAQNYGRKFETITSAIQQAVEGRLYNRNIQQIVELRSLLTRSSKGSTAFILNLSHSLLDSWYIEVQHKAVDTI